MGKIGRFFLSDKHLILCKEKIKCFFKRKHLWEVKINPPAPVRIKCKNCGKIKIYKYE